MKEASTKAISTNSEENIITDIAQSNKKVIEVNDTNITPEQENSRKNRKLGDEWGDWDGKINTENITSESEKTVFLSFALAVIVIFNMLLYSCFYLITPRLSQFHNLVPDMVLFLLLTVTTVVILWYLLLLITSFSNLKLYFLASANRLLFGFLLDKVFKLAQLTNYSNDNLANSFVKVANSFVKATKKPIDKEKIILLLPRCLTKESYSETKRISQNYNIEVAVCTGGEAARAKIKEYRPTAVIAVACERDLLSGIKDVGSKLPVLGITNIRPEGPCKNTRINFDELRNSIGFYLNSNNMTKLSQNKD